MPLDPQPADSLSDSACVWLREMNRNSLLQNYSSGKTSTERQRESYEGQLPEFEFVQPSSQTFRYFLSYSPFSLRTKKCQTRLISSPPVPFEFFLRTRIKSLSFEVRKKGKKELDESVFASGHSTPSKSRLLDSTGERHVPKCTPGCACVSPDTARGSSSQPGT